MKILKKSILYTTLILGTLLILVTILSLLYNVQFWYLKALDFPRVQTLIGLLVCLVLFVVVKRGWKTSAWLFFSGLIAAIVVQAYFVWPYTPLASKTVATAQESSQGDNARFSILLANVWMKNEKHEKLLQLITDTDPDMVLAMETNERWMEYLHPLKERYPYTVLHPLDNTYGIALYSKLPLTGTAVKFLHQPDVPSIHTTVALPNGQTFLLHAVHPVPPKPSKHPDNVGEEEVALLKVGKLVARREMPTMVAGDFNDVAWSNTSRLFGTESRLRDVRVGRGLYNSFDATSFLLRWPLDHAYVSEEFRVVELKRLPKFGSDHFPIWVELSLKE